MDSQEVKKKETIYGLFCERVINESWSNVERYKKDIEVILERRTIETDTDLSLLLMASNAFLQKVTLSQAENDKLGLNVSKINSCDNYENCDDCDLDTCDYF